MSPTCSEGDVRLNDGILEICVGGHYGYICIESSTFGTTDRIQFGILACRALGFDPAG